MLTWNKFCPWVSLVLLIAMIIVVAATDLEGNVKLIVGVVAVGYAFICLLTNTIFNKKHNEYRRTHITSEANSDNPF